MKVKQGIDNGRWQGLHRLVFNKWSLTFAVMLLMLSVYVTIDEPQDVLYVNDDLPYQVEKVSGSGELAVIQPEVKNEAEDGGGEQSLAVSDMAAELEKAGEFEISGESDFFINYRMEREKARSRQLELLESLIADEATADEIRTEAQQLMIVQAEALEQELMLESILVAKYGGQAAVFIQPGKASAVLSIDKDKLDDREAEKIAMIVDNYTGIGYENVVVILK